MRFLFCVSRSHVPTQTLPPIGVLPEVRVAVQEKKAVGDKEIPARKKGNFWDASQGMFTWFLLQVSARPTERSVLTQILIFGTYTIGDQIYFQFPTCGMQTELRRVFSIHVSVLFFDVPICNLPKKQCSMLNSSLGSTQTFF